MARKREHPGTTREVYSRRLHGIRTRRGWTQQQLSAELDRIGFPMNRATIAKIETGKRPMEVSELVALAAALDVEPAALFLPLDTKTVALTPGKTVDATTAIAWAAGDGPLAVENSRTYLLESPKYGAITLALEMKTRTAGTATPGTGGDDG
jgi:transcriptional regulator with XRE-family HTH domain